MHGEIASPAELKAGLDALTHFDVHRKWMLGVIAAAVVGILIRFVFMDHFAVPSSSDIERLREDIMTEVREELSKVETETSARIEAAIADQGARNGQPVEQDGP